MPSINWLFATAVFLALCVAAILVPFAFPLVSA